ncbi:MAG: phosphatidylserine/phosphatidylglycerophosphate/cardiolipin synthase family protein [Deltaproteobacteria bacterium]|nr:phosphatidylserine/phosphatidylglycerophosphate/cardiolipin synthase family protein [Deltaproteobacteria bacterium]
MLKVILVSATLSILGVPAVWAGPSSPETLYLNDKSLDNFREFLVSNTRSDANIKISYSGSRFQSHSVGLDDHLMDMGPDLWCNNRWVKSLKVHTGGMEVVIPKMNGTCQIRLGNKPVVQFINDEAYSPVYKRFGAYQEECKYSAEGPMSSNRYRNMSCAQSFDEVSILSDSIESFLVKLEVLLGQKVPKSFIEAQNPYADLDFSKAPKLDAIFLSTLLYQNDFSGQVLARILKFHAQRGTMVNIIGTGYMHSDNATNLFRELTLLSKNIRIQEYKYYEDDFWKKFLLVTNYFRNMHVKALVTLSSSNSRDNVVIVGGRNVHDGFLFQSKPDLARFPELDQAAPDATFAYWQDVEFLIRSKNVTDTVYAHLLKLWNRDLVKTTVEPIAFQTESTPLTDLATKGENVVRHFISLPFSDQHALEKLYVEMLDQAKSSVVISSPYLRPTKSLLKAILRAVGRGVRVDIQTRINLAGDTQAWLYEETNKAAINDLYTKVGVYEWQGNSILHSKIIVVDDKLSFVGSVNLSRRSFVQDVEGGLLIQSHRFNSQLRSLISSYRDQSTQITERQKRNFWASVVLNLIDDQI